MPHNLHDTLKDLKLTAGKSGKFYSLPALEKALGTKISRLPVSIRIVLESVLRNCDGKKVTEEHVKQLANWQPNAARTDEIPFVLARIVLQDFTGVPLLADLAAMRNVAQKMGKNPKTIEPLVPVDLVVDHSVQIDHYGNSKALDLNMKLEFSRNQERYQFMKWGMQAFDTFKVVPPGIGIVHQVNLEYLARGVHNKNGVYYPDTLVGTDSHTTMINGIGVVGWGVGGIEAEAGMLGQPVYFLTPDVVGVHLKGKLHQSVTATDLVLTITEMLRKAKVVGKFVEFFGEGTASLALPDRATIANMAPEYGATMGFFPVDDKTIDYFKGTGRTDAEIEAFAAYFKAQGLYGVPKAGSIDYSQSLELDLSTVMPSLAGPKRPQDRIGLENVKSTFTSLFSKPVAENGFAKASADLGKRIKAYCQHHNIAMRDLDIGVITAAPNFLEADDISEVVASIVAAGGASLLIVDTFAQVTPGANENAGEDMGLALKNARGLREATGAMCLLIHHAGKDASKGARGWSGIKAAADVEIEISREEESPVRQMRTSKMKDGDDNLRWGFKLDIVDVGIDNDGDVITSCIVIETDAPSPGVSDKDRKGAKKVGRVEAHILDTIELVDSRVTTMSLDKFVDLCVEGMPQPEDGKRDTRRQNISRAFKGLTKGADAPLSIDHGRVTFCK